MIFNIEKNMNLTTQELIWLLEDAAWHLEREQKEIASRLLNDAVRSLSVKSELGQEEFAL
jgi:hypothetical protein